MLLSSCLAEHVLCSSISQAVADLPQHCHSYTAQQGCWSNCHISSKMLVDKHTEPQHPKEGNSKYNLILFSIPFLLLLLFLMLLTGIYQFLGLTNAPSNTTSTAGKSKWCLGTWYRSIMHTFCAFPATLTVASGTLKSISFSTCLWLSCACRFLTSF